MTKYKINITEHKTYTIDFLTDTEDEAIELAKVKLVQLKASNTEHYYMTDEYEEVSGVFDITNTEDNFYPENVNPTFYPDDIDNIEENN